MTQCVINRRGLARAALRLAVAALQGALSNARINIASIKDEPTAAEFAAVVAGLEAHLPE